MLVFVVAVFHTSTCTNLADPDLKELSTFLSRDIFIKSLIDRLVGRKRLKMGVIH